MLIKTSDNGVQTLSPRKGFWKLGIPKSENADRGWRKAMAHLRLAKLQMKDQKRTDTHKQGHVEEFGS